MTAIIPCLWNVIRHSQERTRFVQSCRQLLRVASRVDKKYQRCFNVVSTNLDLSPFVSCASFRKSEGQERGEQNPLCYCLIKGNAIWERISSRNAKFWFRITKSHARARERDAKSCRVVIGGFSRTKRPSFASILRFRVSSFLEKSFLRLLRWMNRIFE